jgi:hypothetical protein
MRDVGRDEIESLRRLGGIPRAKFALTAKQRRDDEVDLFGVYDLVAVTKPDPRTL